MRVVAIIAARCLDLIDRVADRKRKPDAVEYRQIVEIVADVGNLVQGETAPLARSFRAAVLNLDPW